ncbi:MAG TPA: pilus assembly protein TadG-related protein [Xanthobacteraceae bacterium]|nr:pilus assembly protein TadG-related protein [Xanthobacteraceae bacterium]
MAPLFGLALVPLVGFVGLALDYSRAAAARTEMQAALDATALALSKEAKLLTADELNARAKQYFEASYQNKHAKNITVTSSLTTNADQLSTIKVAAAGEVETTLWNVLGHAKMDIGTSSEATWGMKRLELVLALDNTLSMLSSNRMTELKKATKSLLDTLYKAAKKADDVKIAIVPFTTAVNIGTGQATATWLDWSHWDNHNGTCKKYKNWNDDGGPKDKATCLNHQGTWTSADRATWNGCVWDREQDNDVKDTTPTAAASTQFQPHQATSGCPTSIIPLSDILQNWKSADLTASSPTSTFGKKVNAMTPTGYTNITIGLAWGWHALTASVPLEQASAPKPDLDKVIILMTDGDNTQNRFSPFKQPNPPVDVRTQKACENVKAAGIKIYTVRLMDGNADLLKNCATNASMYFDVEQASQLNAAFGAIAQNLANLRISK